MSEELDTLISKRKAIAICNQGAVDKLYSAIAELGWDCYDGRCSRNRWIINL